MAGVFQHGGVGLDIVVFADEEDVAERGGPLEGGEVVVVRL